MGLRKIINNWRRMRLYRRKLKVLEVKIMNEGYLASIGCPWSLKREEALEAQYNRLLGLMQSKEKGRHVRR